MWKSARERTLRFKDLQDQILQISYRLPAGKLKIGNQENKNSGCPKFLNLENKINSINLIKKFGKNGRRQAYIFN